MRAENDDATLGVDANRGGDDDDVMNHAAIRYGADGTGLGGLEGFFFRGCDMQPQSVYGVLARIMPTQPPPAPPEQMLHSVE